MNSIRLERVVLTITITGGSYMTSELWKTIKFWLEICAAAYVVVGAVLQYSVMAVPFISTIWKYSWPLIAAYAAFRIFQFGRSLYERFTRLEAQVLEAKCKQAIEDRSNLVAQLEAQAKSHRDSYDEIVRSLQQEKQKRQELEKRVERALDFTEDFIRYEIPEREKLEAQVTELKNSLTASQKRWPTLEERLASAGETVQPTPEKKQQNTRSLADIMPAGLFALGAPPPKRTP